MTINFKPNGDGSAEIQVNSVTRLRVNTAGEVIVNANDNLGALAARSLTTDGYQKLPGGLILQWGRKVTLAATGQVITFPIPFPNACLNATGSNSGSDANFTTAVYSATTTGALCKTQNASSGALSAGQVDWFAIGY